MNTDKMDAVVTAVKADMSTVTVEQIEEFINADWREADHTQWLSEASIIEIADWVVAGLR